MGKVAVMGAGSWGSTFATICADAAGHDVVLWARRAEVAAQINTHHTNLEYLGDAELNPDVLATADAEQAMRDADIIVLAIPSHALRASLSGWTDLVAPGALAVSLIKGIATDTHQRASQIITQVWDHPPAHVAVLSGPNLARECIARQPTATVVAGPDHDVLKRVQAACHSDYFRVYTNTDLVGVELGGAIKNPIAIAAGVADGLGYGHNSKASVMTRGLLEMTRLGRALGGDPLTFSGLAGAGDLMATCMSDQSRNHHVGAELGRGVPLEQIIQSMNMVAEGVRSSRAILDLAADCGVEMPIIQQVVRVVHDGADPAQMAQALMDREPKEEFHGFGDPGPTSDDTEVSDNTAMREAGR